MQHLSIADDLPSSLVPMLKMAAQHIERGRGVFSKLDQRATHVGLGSATFLLTPNENFVEGGVLHGGTFVMALDTILIYTIWTKLNQYRPIATVNLNTDYLTTALPGTPLICKAVCNGIEDNIAYCAGEAICQATGKLIATTTGTFIVSNKGVLDGATRK